eukprot:TRINITY_DN9819_c0_g1_i1.p1 TRINITY_DN9819_c0_g1~~TRINITY_DN9819_c0_g1_i1.p1  ORF type:complete len:554 (+),score=150.78 TRINITY_DN9819_c0_g1_i1:112-1773(+)
MRKICNQLSRAYCTGASDKGWATAKDDQWTVSEKKRQLESKDEPVLSPPKGSEEYYEAKRQKDKEIRSQLETALNTNNVDFKSKSTMPDPWEAQPPAEEESKAADAQNTLKRRETLIGKKRTVIISEAQEVAPEAFDEAMERFEESEQQTSVQDAKEAGISNINHPEVTEDNYNTLVEEESVPLILSCWAPHVDDCIANNVNLRLLVNAVNSKQPEKPLIKLMTLDCNTNYNLSTHLNITSLPTMLAIHDGSQLEQQTGMVDDESLAQFVFGFAQFTYGENCLEHLKEELPICKLIDARVALKSQDYTTAYQKYTEVYGECMAKVVEERKRRATQIEEGEYISEAARSITDNEVMAAKSMAGMCLVQYHQKNYRATRRTMHALQKDLPKAYRVLADVKKTVATVDIMMLTEYHQEDVEDLEDEERIDQHNLDIKLKLIGAYFGAGDYHKTLSTTFILMRKNYEYKDGITVLIMTRVMTYLGKHHPIREEYNPIFFDLIHVTKRRAGLIQNKKLLNACSEGHSMHSSPLPEEVPLMIDPSPFRREHLARHPLLQ